VVGDEGKILLKSKPNGEPRTKIQTYAENAANVFF